MADRSEWRVVGALVVATALLALLLSPGGARSGLDPRPSSFRATPNGVLGLYLLLEELDIPVERRTSALVQGEPLPGALAILAPTQGFAPTEVDSLRRWLERGGRLLYAAQPGDTLLATLGLLLDDTFADSVDAGTAAGLATPVEGHPFAEDAEGTAEFRFAFADSSPAFDAAQATALLRFPDGQVGAVLVPVGNGVVMAWSDAAPLANRSVRSGSAALIFARAAREFTSAGGALEFDEFHHGFTGGGSPAAALAAFVRDTRAGRMSLQLALVGGGLLLLLGSRFGAPVPPPPPRRRSPLEHLNALAGAYRAGNARQRARHLLLVGVARRLGRRPPAPGEEVAFLSALSNSAIGAREAAGRLLEEWQRTDGSDLTLLAAQADHLVNETKAT